MGALPHQQIRTLITGSIPLISNYRDLEQQLQPNGIDLTVQSLTRFQDGGHLGLANQDRRLPATTELSFDQEGKVFLHQGAYLVTLNEIVHLPDHLMALARPRSSLLRSGAAIHNAVWDAGYHGRSQVLLVVYNPYGFTLVQNSRILQLIFITLESTTSKPYAGGFQKENL